MSRRVYSPEGGRLSPQHLRTLQANAPTPADILDNPEFARELHEEIEYSYDQEAAKDKAARDQALAGAIPLAEAEPEVEEFPVERRTSIRETALRPEPEIDDPEEALTRQLEELRAAKAERQRAAEEAAARQAAEAPAGTAASSEDPDDARVAALMRMFNDTPGAPTQKQIDDLKSKYGNSVYLVTLGEGDVYLFTHLRRAQFQKIQQVVGELAAQESFKQRPEDAMKEKVLQMCILWPRPLSIEFMYNSRAGVVDTLYELIMVHSYFLSVQQAMVLTTQL